MAKRFAIVQRPCDRNFGCRVSDDYHYRGLRTVVLENSQLRLSVLVDKGTDIFELLYKPMDIDFMYRFVVNWMRSFLRFISSPHRLS